MLWEHGSKSDFFLIGGLTTKWRESICVEILKTQLLGKLARDPPSRAAERETCMLSLGSDALPFIFG